MNDIDDQLLAAHAAQDTAALVRLYQLAADQSTDKTAERFYLTHAYVFALEIRDQRTGLIRERLIDLGAEPAA